MAEPTIAKYIAFYTNTMDKMIDNLETEDELEEYHEKAKASTIENFSNDYKDGYPEDVKQAILAEIEEAFEEFTVLFQLKLEEIEQIKKIKPLLLQSRTMYNEEMEKHFKNDPSITLEGLDVVHQQLKQLTMSDLSSKVPLSNVQKAEAEKYIDAMLKKYVRLINMRSNTKENGIAIGIDLGTSFCCVAVYYKDKVIIIPSHEQQNSLTTPSYVLFDKDKKTSSVGWTAKRNAYLFPERTIYDAKRIIGREMEDEELRKDVAHWPFKVKEENGVPKIEVNEKLLYPEHVSGILLSKLRGMAEKHLTLEKGSIKKAVITVPAYFNDGQRQATIDAGRIAGLEVLTILNEPTAAAIAYSLERLDDGPKKILIYDLGGGTFDVAVLEMTGNDIKVLGVNGDTHLGGVDFDMTLVDYSAECFKEETGIDLRSLKESSDTKKKTVATKSLRRLQSSCEQAKLTLTCNVSTSIAVDGIFNGEDLCVEISREKFEELNESKFKKTIELVDKTLKDVNLKKEEIDDIVLVGGSSAIPRVLVLLTEYFAGKALNHSINADQAVAYGAAIQAAYLNGERRNNDLPTTKDVTPMPIGINSAKGHLSVVIPKNEPIPTTKPKLKIYETSEDYQTAMTIQVYQGENIEIAANNKLLGEFQLHGIPSKPKGEEKVEMWMKINEMGILVVEAICRSNQERKSITVKEDKRRMSEETIRKIIAEGFGMD